MSNFIFRLFDKYNYKIFSLKTKGILKRINALERAYQNELSDADLPKKTEEFKRRIANGESLDSLLPEAYALVKNAARRLCGKDCEVLGHIQKWNMVFYDVQIIGAIALQKNMVAEIATGEGKTLVATMPAYLNALTGKGCHIATVNEYLAARDSQWMGYLYNMLGLTCACSLAEHSAEEKKRAYLMDITYSTASEFGFDYLRDNSIAMSPSEQVQRGFEFCLVDEADSVLIDEARTPLIISGEDSDEEEPDIYKALIPQIEDITARQAKICNALARDSQTLLATQGKPTKKILENLLLVKKGMPRNRVLQKIVESGKLGKKLAEFENEMSGDLKKQESYTLRENLYYWIDEKAQTSDLTEKGRLLLSPQNSYAFTLPDINKQLAQIDVLDIPKIEKLKQKMSAQKLYSQKAEKIHALYQLLKAYSIYERDIEYLVSPEGKVEIIDKNTGRVMEGRRWSDGLHQAIEAKERVEIQRENKTYATISIQNYFRMYKKLAGMTGTAESQTGEFAEIYKLQPVKIPTNKPCRREDLPDLIFATKREKFQAIGKIIKDAHAKGQPVLVGTSSVEDSELLSRMLKMHGINHNVLNAKNHAKEADIIAGAGKIGAVTISTNMAGRGTDIKLQHGAEELGGLLVVGAERHESQRVDRQLIGRCARQGDLGQSIFVISLEDELLRVYADTSFIAKTLAKNRANNSAFSHPILNRVVERAQNNCEGEAFAARKHLLGFDDASNKQREIIYKMRNFAISDEFSCAKIDEIASECIKKLTCENLAEDGIANEKNLQNLQGELSLTFPIEINAKELLGLSPETVAEKISQRIAQFLNDKREIEVAENSLEFERLALVSAIDDNWQKHLSYLEDMKDYIYLRSYAQKNPMIEYKIEAFNAFERMLEEINFDVCKNVFKIFFQSGFADSFAEKIDDAKTKKQVKIR